MNQQHLLRTDHLNLVGSWVNLTSESLVGLNVHTAYYLKEALSSSLQDVYGYNLTYVSQVRNN